MDYVQNKIIPIIIATIKRKEYVMKMTDEEYAKSLRDSWSGEECNCITLAQEYILGCGTGDYYCKQCGKWFTQEELNKRKKN